MNLRYIGAELGLLVWQDFQFACGVYPAHEEFVNSVKVEAEENVKRLRNHPCMAVFCGNNEGNHCGMMELSIAQPRSYIDYQQVLQWGGMSPAYRQKGVVRLS
jgi:beta-mannosidase